MNVHDTTTVQIHLFGSPRLRIAGQTVPLVSSSTATLVGYLALQASSHTLITRSRLAGTLFPDQTEAQARRSLSQALYRLRRLFGEQAEAVLHADGESLSLDRVWIDVGEFRALAASSSLDDWRSAIELYTGDLLENLDAEWTLGQRANLHELYLALLERTCLTYSKSGEWATALGYAHRWALADPLREEAQQTTMKLYGRLGRYAAALQQFNHYSQLLQEELQIEPLPETRALADRLRIEFQQHASAVEPPIFVGRQAERAKLLAKVERAQTERGGLVLLEGEPGIGKSSLLEQVAEGARWRGLDVVWGRAHQLGGTTPYSPLFEALQTALLGPREERVRAHLNELAAQVVKWLFSQARSLSAQAPAALLNSEPESQTDLTNALIECVRAIAELNAHVIILEDMQWAGTDVWEILPKLIEQTADSRLLWILSCRSDDLRADPIAWEAFRSLDRELAPDRFRLSGLTPRECSDLAHELGQVVDAESAQQLYVRTDGNPLFLREALLTPEAHDGSFRTLLERRLTALPLSARAALEAGAVLGREFTHGRWQALTGADLLATIPVLVTTRFIQETERGYLLQHDLTREQIYRAIAPNRLKDLHRWAAEIMMRERAAPAEVAWHFEQAGQWPDAVCQYYGAGDHALAAYAYTTAAEHYTHALDLLHYLAQPAMARLSLLRRRQRALGVLMRLADWRADVDEIEQLAVTLNDSTAVLEALTARVTILVLQGSTLEALQAIGSRALSLAAELEDHSREAHLARTIGRHIHAQLARPAQAVPYLRRAAELAEATHDRALLVSTLCNLAATYTLTGRCALARETAGQALRLIEQHPELHALHAEALEEFGEAATYLAEWETSQSILRQVMQEQLALGKLWEMGEAAFQFIITSAEMGQFEEAQQTAEMVLTMAAQLNLDVEHADVLVLFKILHAYADILAGQLEEAGQNLEVMPLLAEESTATRVNFQSLAIKGLLKLVQGDNEQAAALLSRSIELSPPELIEAAFQLLYHVIAAHRAGDSVAAQHALARAEQLLSASDVTRYNVLLHYARFQVTGSQVELHAAHSELQRQAALFKDDRLRADFIKRVPLHREVEAQWQSLQSVQPPITVRLARIGVPLGKPLIEGDRIDVRWTIDDGSGDAEVFEREGKAALRQRRLRRLLAEAQSQGAAPTDADLAQALDVALRTIERDLQALRASGVLVTTRRRK